MENEKYIVLQRVVNKEFYAEGSSKEALANLQTYINEQAEKGYKLHTFSTVASDDNLIATLIFERLN